MTHQDDEVDCTPFPQQLMEILCNEEYSGIIHWLPHGKGFIVSKKQDFASQIMPLYFRKSRKYPSFARKLTRWGFVRVSSGPEIGAYYHKYFLRDKPRLCQQIHCEQSKMKTNEEAIPHQTHPRHSTLSYSLPSSQTYQNLSNDIQLVGNKLACLPEKFECTNTIGNNSKIFCSAGNSAAERLPNCLAIASIPARMSNYDSLNILLANINNATHSTLHSLQNGKS